MRVAMARPSPSAAPVTIATFSASPFTRRPPAKLDVVHVANPIKLIQVKAQNFITLAAAVRRTPSPMYLWPKRTPVEQHQECGLLRSLRLAGVHREKFRCLRSSSSLQLRVPPYWQVRFSPNIIRATPTGCRKVRRVGIGTVLAHRLASAALLRVTHCRNEKSAPPEKSIW